MCKALLALFVLALHQARQRVNIGLPTMLHSLWRAPTWEGVELLVLRGIVLEINMTCCPESGTVHRSGCACIWHVLLYTFGTPPQSKHNL